MYRVGATLRSAARNGDATNHPQFAAAACTYLDGLGFSQYDSSVVSGIDFLQRTADVARVMASDERSQWVCQGCLHEMRDSPLLFPLPQLVRYKFRDGHHVGTVLGILSKKGARYMRVYYQNDQSVVWHKYDLEDENLSLLYHPHELQKCDDEGLPRKMLGALIIFRAAAFSSSRRMFPEFLRHPPRCSGYQPDSAFVIAVRTDGTRRATSRDLSTVPPCGFWCLKTATITTRQTRSNRQSKR